MSNNRLSDAENVFYINVAIVIIAVGIGSWFFAKLINVDFNTGITFVVCEALVLGVTGWIKWNDFLPNKVLIAGCLGGVIWSFFPVLGL